MGAAPYTLSQHSGVGRSSIGRWTVVHTRNSNMSESRIAPDAEAGFLPSSSGQQHQQLINPSSLPMPPPPYEEDPPAYDTLNLSAEPSGMSKPSTCTSD